MIRILILLFIPLVSYSSQLPISKVGVCDEALVLYIDKTKCEEAAAEECIKIDASYVCDYALYNTREEDDLSSPIEECTDTVVIVDEVETTTTECTIIGYEKKTIKEIIEDPAKKAIYDADKAAKDAAKETKKQQNEALLEKLGTEDLKVDEINNLLRSIYL